MKKSLITLAGSAAFLLTLQAQADVAGIEVGGYQWSPDYSGTLASDGTTLPGTQIDIQQDLGFDSDDHNIIWASIEHPVPMLPNIKIVSSDLQTSAQSPAGGVSFDFNGITFNEDVATSVDFSNVEYTFYYEILDNWLNLDAGLTIRQYDGQVEIIGQTTNQRTVEDLDFALPLLYVKGRVDLPFTGFFVDGEANIISYDNDKISDLLVGLGYESEIGLGAKAGYRTFTLEVDEDGFTSDLEFKGAYVSVFFHF